MHRPEELTPSRKDSGGFGVQRTVREQRGFRGLRGVQGLGKSNGAWGFRA